MKLISHVALFSRGLGLMKFDNTCRFVFEGNEVHEV